MTGPRRALKLRTLLVGIGLTAIAYVSALTLQVVVVLRPAADELLGATSELLEDHDRTLERVQDVVQARQLAGRHLGVRGIANVIEPSVDSIRGLVTALIDEGSQSRVSIEGAEIPLAIRLQLAQAIAHESFAAVRIVDALRFLENGEQPAAEAALGDANVATDSAVYFLSTAQRIALLQILDGEQRLLERLGTLDRWSQAWVVVGLLLLAGGVVLVRSRFYLPVSAMERGVARITAGDLTTEIPVRRDDELGVLAAHVNDMTAVLRERAAEEMRARESLTEHFGRVLDESSNEICVFDARTGLVLQANRGLRDALGYTSSEIVLRRIDDLVTGLDDARLGALLEDLRRGTQERVLISTWLRRRDGSIRPAEVALQYLASGETPVFILLAEDAGVRQRVRELDGRLRALTETEQERLHSGDLTRALPPLVRFATEALDATNADVWQLTADAPRSVAHYASAAATDDEPPTPSRRYEESATRGRLRAEIRVAGRQSAFIEVEATNPGRIWTAEEQAFLGRVADLAARAFEAHERRTLEQALERAQRMDSIGQLAGGVAHDFNNILTAILGNLEACRSELEPGVGMDTALAEAEHAALRAADLTRQLLTFARRQVVETTSVDIAARAREAESMLRRLIGPDVRFELVLDDDLGTVRLGAGQLEQLLVNLVVNARDAMPSGGSIRVRAHARILSAAQVTDFPGLAPGRFVELTVTDSGVGMDARTVERVFEPFFTTKRVGEGTGLGLAVCYGIVRNAGGAISVSSAPGRGSSFRLLIPSGARASDPTGTLQTPSTRGGNLILLAEDEPAIRTLMLRMLGARGFRVVAAADGEQALALAESLEEPLGGLVTDVVMPGIGGVALAQALRKRHPGLPVLFMSGYTATTSVQTGDLADAGFISKPFTPEDLVRRLSELLAASPPRPGPSLQ